MFDMKKKVEKIKEIKNVQRISVENDASDYAIGFYNGVEVVLALIEERGPEYLTVVREPEVKQGEEQELKKRTANCGFVKRKEA